MNTSQETLSPHKSENQIAFWLLAVCAAIFFMVVLGGVTRLTHSGLSMVEWEPIMGIVPPLDQAEWEATFDKYKLSPEYQLNVGMDLDGFKSIFMLEYIHRVWGRLIGLIFLLPFFYFLIKGKIKKSMTPKLVIMFVLGGLQGVLGWYMVKSGLVHDPQVSQYRLTAHLAAAFIIYAYIFWTALNLLFPRPAPHNVDARPLQRFALIVTGLLSVTIISGGFVAGLKAGLAYNTFPLMDGEFIPGNMFALEHWYLNFFDNIATVQFNHRLLAEASLIVVAILWFVARSYQLSGRARMGFHLLLAMAAVQVILGIMTLLLVVPTWLAATHQAGALVLFTLALNVNHSLLTARSLSELGDRSEGKSV